MDQFINVCFITIYLLSFADRNTWKSVNLQAQAQAQAWFHGPPPGVQGGMYNYGQGGPSPSLEYPYSHSNRYGEYYGQGGEPL
jgi:hypothetical protein